MLVCLVSRPKSSASSVTRLFIKLGNRHAPIAFVEYRYFLDHFGQLTKQLAINWDAGIFHDKSLYLAGQLLQANCQSAQSMFLNDPIHPMQASGVRFCVLVSGCLMAQAIGN
jgi:hypothetical protein